MNELFGVHVQRKVDNRRRVVLPSEIVSHLDDLLDGEFSKGEVPMYLVEGDNFLHGYTEPDFKNIYSQYLELPEDDEDRVNFLSTVVRVTVQPKNRIFLPTYYEQGDDIEVIANGRGVAITYPEDMRWIEE